MDSNDGEINIGCLSRMQIDAFCEKMISQGYIMHCELYEWIPKDHTEVSMIMHRDSDGRKLFLFCLQDNTWVLCSDYKYSLPHSKLMTYA